MRNPDAPSLIPLHKVFHREPPIIECFIIIVLPYPEKLFRKNTETQHLKSMSMIHLSNKRSFRINTRYDFAHQINTTDEYSKE